MKSEWPVVALGEHIRIKHGFAFQGQHFAGHGEYIVLTPGNFIEEGGFKAKSGSEKFYDAAPPLEYVLNRGDLVIAMTEQAQGLLGSSAMIPCDGVYLHNQRIGLVELRSHNVDRRFLYYLFNTRAVRAQIQATATGSKVRHTAPSRVESVKVHLPPPSTQRKIAAILSAYDDLIENNNRRIRIHEEMAQRIYREWFVDFRYPGHESVPLVDSELGPIPNEWSIGTLDSFLVLQRGFDLPKQDRTFGHVPVVSATGVSAWHEIARVAGPGVVTGRSGSIGTVQYIHDDFWPLNTTLWVREFRRATPQFAFFVLRSIDLKSFNSGAAVPTLNRNDISSMAVVVPPKRLVAHFTTWVTPVLREQRVLELANDNLRATRDLLLPRLISGEIDVDNMDITLDEEAAA
jgi:type I restriction enzyme, S subunit